MKHFFPSLLAGVGLLLAVAPLPAQDHPPAAPEVVIPPNATNRDELMREALRAAISNETARATRASTNGPAGTTAAAPTPGLSATATNAPAADTNRTAISVRPRPPRPAIAVPPAPRTPAPTNTVAVPPATAAPATNTVATADDEGMVQAMNFPKMPLDQALDIYAGLTDRILLRQSTIAGAPADINIKFNKPLTKSEAIDAFNTVFALNGLSILPVGEKFLKVVATTTAGQEAGVFSSLGASELSETGQFITKTIQLKNAKPSELAPALQPFGSGKAQNNIMALDNNQILVLRDYAPNIKRMLELIEQIDKVTPLDVDLEVIPIKYALASDISSVLGSLTAGGGGGVGGTAGVGGSRSRSSARGGRGGGAGGVSNYGNTTGVNGTMNQPGQVNQQLGGANAARAGFQNRLSQIATRATGGDFQILSEAKIIPDERTNAILIFANKEDMTMIKKIVALLDVVQQQVLIEAIIMEVSLHDNINIGVSAAQAPKDLSSTVTTAGGSVNGAPFFKGLTSNGTNLSAFPNNLPSGFSYFGKINPTWDVALKAIAEDGSINVLQRPRIQTSHAEEATLFIGETRPYVTGTYFGGYGGTGGSSSQYQQKQIGITLTVLPLINQDGLVVMDIDQQIQAVGENVTIDNNQVPTTTDRNARAKVAVRDGDTIILGGFISTSKNRTKSGVPLLKDIPLLGYLFRSTSDDSTRKELVVLIRPTVLKTPQDAAIVAKTEREKLSAIRLAEQDEKKAEAARAKQAEAALDKK